MANIIEVDLDDNTKIYLEATDVDTIGDGQFKPIGNQCGTIAKAKDYLDGTLNQIKTFANGIANSVKDLASKPDEVEVEFSVKFAAEAGIIITSTSSEASVSIKLKWTKQ